MRRVSVGSHWWLVALVLASACGDATSPEQRMAARVESLRGDPAALGDLLRRMPKGGDLHSHLTGAVRTESLIDWGIEADLCVDDLTLASSGRPCGSGQVPMRDAAGDPELHGRILAAWSMDGFSGSFLEGHQHFFDTFGKFGAATTGRTPDILVQLRREAVDQEIVYLEIMSSLGSSTVSTIGADHLPPDVAWTPSYLLAMRDVLLDDPRFAPAVESGLALVAQAFAESERQLGCDGPSPEPGCEVELRLQCHGTRINPRAAVFAQFLYCYELAQRDQRIVGINLVAPEENPVSLAFYDDDMLAVGTLRDFYAGGDGRRAVPVALHAGELVPAILPDTPEGQANLTFHIRHAIALGGATRIGHGSDLEWEYQSPELSPETLLATMREQGILVEICLTSSEVVLDLSGPTHPLATYLAHDVPVALATDDEGVLRTDLTHEYARAILVQDLDYPTLKRLSRNALEYSFAPGASLWASRGAYAALVAPCAGERPGGGDPAPQCAQYLADNRRAALQWRLEQRFASFEGDASTSDASTAEADAASTLSAAASPPA